MPRLIENRCVLIKHVDLIMNIFWNKMKNEVQKQAIKKLVTIIFNLYYVNKISVPLRNVEIF